MATFIFATFLFLHAIGVIAVVAMQGRTVGPYVRSAAFTIAYLLVVALSILGDWYLWSH